MSETCATCKHWVPCSIRFGICGSSSFIADVECLENGMHSIETRNTFGCIHHEKKESK